MRFEPNRNLERELRRDLQVLRAVNKAAVEVRRHARRIATQEGAPWMRRKGKALIETEVHSGGVRVVNTDYGGHLQEFGSKNSEVVAPLRRGARAAGLPLREQDL